MFNPIIIQGGMGIGVSGWPLARAVSTAGQLGVVSGTALDSVLAWRLQTGDPAGDVRRALRHFPFPEMAERIVEQYFVEGGKAPVFSSQPPQRLTELAVAANFVEVFLAKEGHDGLVGINFLEKIQLPTLPSIFGAMLAGVDYIVMGAGIPRAIPGILDELAQCHPVKLKLDVEGALPGEEFVSTFDPQKFSGDRTPRLKRPRFLAVIASATLAMTLAKKSSGRVDGFVVEGPSAGGHNAPPRGPMQLDGKGEPIYGERDIADLDKIKALGLPFWLAGSFGHPGKLAEALQLGAAGVQVGTAFAFCDESGIDPEIKRSVIRKCIAGAGGIFTDPVASPTGYPFKVVQLEGTLSEPEVYAARRRVCDHGYLRSAYRTADGRLGFRCPGEPLDDYVRKGGDPADTPGRKCLCNSLLANIGLAQSRAGGELEKPLLTAGDDIVCITRFVKPGRDSYTASDVLADLLAATH